MVLYPNKLPESERVCFGICKMASYSQYFYCHRSIIGIHIQIKYPITATKQLPGIHKALTRSVSGILGFKN